MIISAALFRFSWWESIFFTNDAVRHLFNLYVVNIATQIGAIYGPLSGFVIFLLWIYYAACIFLIGAELSALLMFLHGGSDEDVT